MQKPLSFIQKEQHLWLSPERCIYWEEEKALILSDLHFGKTGHFRKAGIAMPQNVYKEDLHRLVQLLQYFQPANLIVVGDFFHSDDNKELDLFKKWRNDFSHISIQLVKGNHDILTDRWYEEADLAIHNHELFLEPFAFMHDVTQTAPNAHRLNYTFSGHIHPGIRVHGGGKQSLRFACFYFAKDYAVLPAFSRFTGTYLVEPKPAETVFAIVENKIVQVQ
jgi:DNA ligase-associated metallophosphoesterase